MSSFANNVRRASLSRVGVVDISPTDIKTKAIGIKATILVSQVLSTL